MRSQPRTRVKAYGSCIRSLQDPWLKSVVFACALPRYGVSKCSVIAL